MRNTRALACAALIMMGGIGAAAGEVRPSAFADRQWEAIAVPGAKCGNGEDYIILFSAGSRIINGNPNNRVVIWLPGGGSTQIDSNGELNTAIKRLPQLRSRRGPPNVATVQALKTNPAQQEYIFMNHPDNDPFVKDAHWAIVPYTTQDFHSGRKTEPKVYDFTGTLVASQMEREINKRGGTAEQAEKLFPGLSIKGKEVRGKFVIHKLEVSIYHQGAINVDLSLKKLFERLEEEDFDIRKAAIVMSGSSAGGFGTWYNAWRVGDILYPYPDTRFTVIPQAGSPSIMRWSDEKQDIVVDEEQVAAIKHRLGWHDVRLPTAIPGAAYQKGDEGLDVLDLLDHYLNRWKGMDVQFLVILNREDFLAVRGLDEEKPGFEVRLENFCKTVHRYSQYVSLTENAQPYLGWLFTGGTTLRRVHGFKGATLVVDQMNPNGEGKGGKSVLEYINMVATRKIDGPPQIEHTAGVVENDAKLDSPGTPRKDYMQQCIVPWPEKRRP
jgi:hypothetical protein